MLAYYSNSIADGVYSAAPLTRGSIIFDLAKMEFTVVVVMKFLTAAPDGEHLGAPSRENPPGCSILYPLLKVVLTILDDLIVFDLGRASSFHAASSYRVVNLSCSID